MSTPKCACCPFAVLIATMLMFAFPAYAFAADNPHDRTKLDIVTDKTSYQAGEVVTGHIAIINDNEYPITDVALSFAQDSDLAFTVKPSSPIEAQSVAPGQTLQMDFTVQIPADENESAQGDELGKGNDALGKTDDALAKTDDALVPFLIGFTALLLMAGIVLLAARKKNAGAAMLSCMLSVALVSSVTVNGLTTKQAFGDEGTLKVTKTIDVKDEAVILTAEASYENNASQIPTVEPFCVGDNGMRGTGVSGASIFVTLPDGTELDPVTVGDGMLSSNMWANYDSKIKALTEGAVYQVRQQESGKGMSNAVFVTVGLRTAPPMISEPVCVGDQTITGTGVPGAYLSVERSSNSVITSIGYAVVAADGTWTVDVSATSLVEGDLLMVFQIEEGKARSYGANTNVRVRSPQPTVAPFCLNDTAMTGTGIYGASIIVTLPGTQFIDHAQVNSEGNWSMPFTPGTLELGAVYHVSQEIPGQVESYPVEVTVTERSADPVMHGPLKVGAQIIDGTGVAGAHIVVMRTHEGITTEIGNAYVDAQGNWSISIPSDLLVLADKIVAFQVEEGKARSYGAGLSVEV